MRRRGAATPCEDWPVAVLLGHLLGLTVAFTASASKSPAPASTPEPDGDLPADWKPQLHERLDALVVTWRVPEAWEGETEAGGVTMPAEVMGVVALDELVLHGWDLARATGQPFDADPTACRRRRRVARLPAGRCRRDVARCRGRRRGEGSGSVARAEDHGGGHRPCFHFRTETAR